MGNQQLKRRTKMEQEKLAQRIRDKFPDENYSVLHYGEDSSKNTVIKCLDCGKRIEVNTGELLRKRRQHICANCHYKRKDTIRNEEIIKQRLEQKAHNIKFFMEESGGIRHHMVEFVCNKCHHMNTARVANFLRYKYDCVYCEGKKENKDTDIFITEMEEKFGKQFTLCSDYVDSTTSIRIRCNKCGFIRNIKPNAFLQSGYCPRCGDKSSKGEKVISSYLKNHNITFESQKYFTDWNIGLHYFDFYLPDFSMVIEFNGIQHYQFNEFFHKTQDEFNYRKEKDEIKKNAALEHHLTYVSISYLCFSELNFILDKLFNSTTIPNGSRGKCLEIETIQDLDEDIV